MRFRLIVFAIVAIQSHAANDSVQDVVANGLTAASAGNEKKLATINTGASGELQGIGAGINDLIPHFTVSFNDGNVSEDGQIKKIGLTYSPPSGRVVDLGFTAVVEKPQVYGALEERGLVTSAQREALADQLSLGDSLSVMFTASAIGEVFGHTYGRSLSLYEREIEQLFDVALSGVDPEAQSARQEVRTVGRNAALKALNDAGCPTLLGTVQQALNERPLSEASVLERVEAADLAGEAEICKEIANAGVAALVRFTQASRAMVDELTEQATRIKFFNLPNLVDRQPQLLVSLMYKDQDELAGPDEFGLRLTWEASLGHGNLNDLTRSGAWRSCKTNALGGQACVEAVAQLMAQLNGSSSRQTQWRFALNGEWRHRDDQRIFLEDPDVMLDIDGDETIAVSATLLAKTWLNDDSEPYVFEMGATYESNESSDMNDRALVSLTGTRNVAPGFSLSLGLVWANRPEFRGAVDEELSAKLGLNYKLSRL